MSSDAELMARICTRDEQAFEEISERYRTKIERHVNAILRDDSAAEDVVQEVFVRLWTRTEQWQGQGSLQAWLFRIATNLALNHLRALSRQRQQSLEAPAEPFDENDESTIPAWLVDHSLPSPDLIAERDERQRLLQQLVAALPAEKQAVVRLAYEQDMAPRQIAHALGIPEGTVKSRFHYALKQLARTWRELEHEEEDLI